MISGPAYTGVYRKNTRVHRRIQDCIEEYKSAQKNTRVHRRIQDCIEEYKSAQKNTRVHNRIQECTEEYKSAQKNTRVHRRIQECNRRVQVNTREYRNRKCSSLSLWPKVICRDYIYSMR